MRDIYVYGYIGKSWDEEDKSAAQFAKDLKDANGEDVTIHVNSGGGDAFDANTMAETLRGYSGGSTTIIEGIAASAASYFALTADRVFMSESALMMIHNPYSCVMGDADDMRHGADFLDKVKQTIVNQYVRKTGRDEKDISALMDDETWFTAKDALEMGLVDELTQVEPVENKIDLSCVDKYKNAPKDLLERVGNPGGGVSGEPEPTIPPANDAQPEVESTGGGEESEPKRVVCVNGQFLYC